MRHPVRLLLVATLERRYFVPVCFAVYLGLRLAVIVFVPIQQHSDEAWYVARAVAIATGQGYSEKHILTAYWPIGWPGFLGIVFRLTYPSPVVGQIVNWLCSAAIFIFTLRLGARLFADDLVGRLSVLILTICPNQIAYVPMLSTEVFYTALLLFAVDLLVSGPGGWRLAAAGATFGVAALTKAQTVLLPAMLFGVWWFAAGQRRRVTSTLAQAIAVYAMMALVILPWAARNYSVFGEIVPISTNGGLTLLAGNNPSARGDDAENDALVKQVPHDVAHQIAADHLAKQLAIQWIREHPQRFLVLIPEKIMRLWLPDGEAEWAYEAGFAGYDKYWSIFRALRVINQAYYLGIMLLFLLSIWIGWRERRMPSTEFTTGYALILFTTSISVIFSGQSRFHFPMIPWLAMYAAWSILQLLGGSRSEARVAAA